MSHNLFLARSPLPAITLPFLFTGPVFGILAALLVLQQGDALLLSRWMPQTLAAVHLLTLGFLGTTMLGALLQVTAVMLGRGAPLSRPYAHLLYAVFVAGTACLCAGFLFGIPLAFRFALVLLVGTLPVFWLAVGRRLLPEWRRRDTARALTLALAAFVLVGLLGLRLASGWGWQDLGIPRQLTDLHLRFALFGWVGVLVMAVSFEVVPMFQFTPAYSMRERRWLAPLVLLGLALFWLLMRLVWPVLIADILLYAGLVIFAFRTLWLQRQSRRHDADATRRLFRAAMLALLLAGPLWLAARFGGALGARLAMAATVLYLLGFALGCVNGMLHKIVPFLLTLRLQRRRWELGARALGMPKLRDFIPEPAALLQYRLSLAGTVGMTLAALYPEAWLVRLAALLLLFAWTLLLFNLFRALRLFREHAAPAPVCQAR